MQNFQPFFSMTLLRYMADHGDWNLVKTTPESLLSLTQKCLLRVDLAFRDSGHFAESVPPQYSNTGCNVSNARDRQFQGIKGCTMAPEAFLVRGCYSKRI